MQISEIHLYPIKSLAGIPVQEASLSDRGLIYDRRWMLVDPQGQFLTQRKFPQMALLQPAFRGSELIVRHKNQEISPLSLALHPQAGPVREVQIWRDRVTAWLVDPVADDWFSEQLGMNVQLVYMPDESHRFVQEKHAVQQEIVSFADGTQYLIIGQASLDYLNAQLEQPVPMNRFRPNLVFTGGKPHEEDQWQEIRIGGTTFYGVGTCIRCQVPNIDQATGLSQQEPNRTLARYRQQDHQIHFGMNLAHQGSGKVAVGMPVEVLRFSGSRFSG